MTRTLERFDYRSRSQPSHINLVWYDGHLRSQPSDRLETNVGFHGFTDLRRVDVATVLPVEKGIEVRFYQGVVNVGDLEDRVECLKREASTRCFTVLTPISPQESDVLFNSLPPLVHGQRKDYPNIVLRNAVMNLAARLGRLSYSAPR